MPATRWDLTAARPRGLLVALHVPFVAFAAAQVVVGVGSRPFPAAWSAVPAVLAAAALQLRHSLAAADGVRPRYWPWSLLALVVIAYAPSPALSYRVATLQWFVIASCAMLLPPRWGPVAAVADVLGWGLWGAIWWPAPSNPMQRAAYLLYLPGILAVGGASLYAAARLVRVGEELRATRADLAELAVGRERLRISRDLHDLLGQSLSAVALKGDLAVGLLDRRQDARAAAEVAGLVTLARSALHDLRELARHAPPISFDAELGRGVDLLAAVGVDTRVAIAAGDPPAAVDALFGWTVREGVTNILRHSTATTCAIRLWHRDGALHLELVNDGAAPTHAPGGHAPGGHGLEGLAARAAALAGSVHGERTADGSFRLHVTVPDAPASPLPAAGRRT